LTPNLKPLMMAQNKFISQTSSDTHGWYTMTWEKPDGEKFTVKANIFGDIENDPLAKRTYKMHLEDLACVEKPVDARLVRCLSKRVFSTWKTSKICQTMNIGTLTCSTPIVELGSSRAHYFVCTKI